MTYEPRSYAANVAERNMAELIKAGATINATPQSVPMSWKSGLVLLVMVFAMGLFVGVQV